MRENNDSGKDKFDTADNGSPDILNSIAMILGITISAAILRFANAPQSELDDMFKYFTKELVTVPDQGEE